MKPIAGHLAASYIPKTCSDSQPPSEAAFNQLLPFVRPFMATRCQFESSSEVGVFAQLTNAYCLVATGRSENFYRYCRRYKLCSVSPWSPEILSSIRLLCSIFEAELAEHIPVIKTSVSGTRLVGRVTVGESLPCHAFTCIGVWAGPLGMVCWSMCISKLRTCLSQ